MIEKRNAIDDGAVKDAAGDAGVLDDIVDMAAGKMAKKEANGMRASSASAVDCPFACLTVHRRPNAGEKA